MVKISETFTHETVGEEEVYGQNSSTAMQQNLEMALMILCGLFAFSAAAVNPIREHPHSVVVTEGMWANFSCGIKLTSNTNGIPAGIKWRIGDFTRNGNEYYSADTFPNLEGVTAERSFVPDITGRILTETIGILATEEMDGTPVECMFVHPTKPIRNSYSKFALLIVHTPAGEVAIIAILLACVMQDMKGCKA